MKAFIRSLKPNPKIAPKLLKFRYGADYAISSNTDLSLNFEGDDDVKSMEFRSYEKSIRGTNYEEPSTSPVVREQYTMNLYECSIYWETDKYFNGSAIVAIPDYYDSTWSASGVSAFPDAVLGAAKPLRYPNIGTQMMYISGGLIGVQLDVPYTNWDKGIGYDGVNNPNVDPQKSDTAQIIATGTNGDGLQGMLNLLNTSPQGNTCFSYRNGQQGTWQLYARHLLQGRNSESSDYSLNQWFDSYDAIGRYQVSTDCTSRVMDTFTNPEMTIQQMIDRVEQDLELYTIPNSGWYNNFAHWQNSSISNMNTYYTMLRDVIDRNSELVWLAGMSEASSYLWFYNMISSISYSNGVVSVDVDNLYNIDLSLISCPVSIEIDLTNTDFNGSDIQSNSGRIVSLDDNKYIVEVFADTLQATISKTSSPDYYNFDNPSVTGESFVTDTLTIDTDILTVCSLFSDTIGTVIERKTSNSLQHIFTGLSTGQTYYLGIMSRENRSIIQTITT